MRKLSTLIVAVCCLVACKREPTPERAPAASASVSTTSTPTGHALSTEWDPSWDALPPQADAVPDVRSMYAFAARHPEVVSYMPCFCGCSARGHRSVENCFITSRDNGKPHWNPMGAG